MYSIGIDLGGTIIKVGLVHSGRIIKLTTLDANSDKGLEIKLPAIQDSINTLLRDEKIEPTHLSGIGMAFPGIVNPIKKSVISTNAKYEDACGLSLEEWVTEKWNVPFFLDNDARLAVIGEWICGVAKGCNNVVMMTIGTGIGTGVILDGRVLYGEHFQAGSLGGHLVVDYKARRCSCGNIGCVEALSSSAFLPSIVKEHPDISSSFKVNAGKYGFKQIFELAALGNKDATILRNQCVDVWSAGIINYIHTYDPEIIVLSGGIMHSKDMIIPYLEKRVDSLAWCPLGKVKIMVSELENPAISGIQYLISKAQKNEKVLKKSSQL